jgi:hypothetical protein
MANGVFFHYTGRTLKLHNGRTESFQTERGMRLALTRSGFVNVCFQRTHLATGEALFVDAQKPIPLALPASSAA